MSNKKIVALLGSPRKKGNSSILAQQTIAGAKSVGAETEQFLIHTMQIQPCAACDACRRDKARRCVIEDDMQILYPKLRQADAILIASPIYWFTLSAQIKLVLDRCYALHDASGHALRGKRVGVTLTYGADKAERSGVANAIHTLEDSFNYTKSIIVGMVYGSASNVGDVEKDAALLQAAYTLGVDLAKT